jgi:hypothetical protein
MMDPAGIILLALLFRRKKQPVQLVWYSVRKGGERTAQALIRKMERLGDIIELEKWDGDDLIVRWMPSSSSNAQMMRWKEPGAERVTLVPDEKP